MLVSANVEICSPVPHLFWTTLSYLVVADDDTDDDLELTASFLGHINTTGECTKGLF